MKKIFFSLGTLAALFVAGCGSKNDATDPNVIVDNNFDTIAGWVPEPQNATLSRDKAHSGHYSIKVDGEHEYSLNYKAMLGQLHATRIKKIKITAWTFVSSADAKASLVTAVSNPDPANDKPLLWEALDLSAGNSPGKWVEVSKEIAIPEAATPTCILGFYLWRTSGNQPVYLDDLRVTVEE